MPGGTPATGRCMRALRARDCGRWVATVAAAPALLLLATGFHARSGEHRGVGHGAAGASRRVRSAAFPGFRIRVRLATLATAAIAQVFVVFYLQRGSTRLRVPGHGQAARAQDAQEADPIAAVQVGSW